MNSDDVRQHLSAYLDGELDAGTRSAVEEALAASTELRADLDSLRRTAELVRSLARTPAPAGFAARVAAALAADAAPAAAPRATWGLWRTVVLAAAGLLLVVGGLLLVPGRSPREKAVKIKETVAAPEPKTEGVCADRPATNAPAPANTEARAEASPTALAPAEPTAEHAYRGADEAKRLAAPADDRATEHRQLADSERERQNLALAGKGVAAVPPSPPRAAQGGVAPGAAAPLEKAGKEAKSPAWAVAEGATQGAAGAAPEQAKGRGEGSAANAARSGEGQVGTLAETESSMIGEILANRSRPAGPLGALRAERRDKAAFGAKDNDAAAAPPRERQVEMAYSNLFQTVAEVRAVFGAAQVPYALQPVGNGEFVVEATIAESEAPILVARLTEVAREVRKPAASPTTGGAPAAMPAAPAPQVQAPRPVVESRGPEGGQAAAGERIRLVLRFRPAAAPAPAER